MKSTRLLFFILSEILALICFVNCTGPSQEKSTFKTTTESNDKKTETDIIHIQFIDKPTFSNMLNTKTKHNTGRFYYLTFYDNYEREDFRFDDIAKNRAVTYSTQSPLVMIRRYFSFFEFQDFFLHKGDSLVMSFDQRKPVVIKHSTVNYKSQDLNIENIINEKYPDSYLTTGLADDTRSVAYKYFYEDPKESKRQQARTGYEKGLYLETLENKMGNNLLLPLKTLKTNSQQIIDSLRNHNHISDNSYNFYQQKYSNLLLKLEIMSGSIDSIQAANRLNAKSKNINFQNEYFNQCLDNFEKKYITSKVKWTALNQFNLRDPKESFTTAKKSSLLNPVVKSQLLFISLNKIDLYFPDETDEYLKMFVNSVTDSDLIRKAQIKYQKDELLNAIPSDLHLLTLENKQTTIEELLKSKKGRIIFIDFWASWCVPCIEEMKYSKEIIKFYDNKQLEVVFFSMDDNYMKWSKASERLEVNFVMNNFKILKSENSKFFQEYKLNSIPRYMVVNKKGKIINANAPRPSDPKIRKLFNELLKQQT